MKVKDMVEQLNTRVVQQLIRENGWKIPAEADETAAKETLSGALLDEPSIRTTWESLTAQEKNVLLYFLFAVGHDIVTYRQMEAFAYASSPIEVYAGLTGIRRKGIVYTLRRLWGEMAYCIPYDLQAVWRSFLRNTIAGTEPEESTAPFAPLPAYFSGQRAAVVLFRLLQQHRHQGIPLTKRGFPTARVRRHWQEHIPYDEALFRPLYSETAGDYSACEHFFLDMMVALKVIEKKESDSGQVYSVQEEAVRELFRGSETSVQQKLYMHVKKTWRTLHPLYPMIWEWLERGQGPGITFQSLASEWEKLVAGQEAERGRAAWEQFREEMLPVLDVLGFLSSITDPLSGEITLGWMINPDAEEEREEGKAAKAGYVQPTFEVLLLPHAPYQVRWGLGRYGELKEQQEVWTFELTKQSVRRPEEADAIGKLLSLLSRIQGEEIAGSVADQIKQWLHQERQVELLHIALLRCPDKETADWVEREPALRGCWQERMNGTDFIVDEHKEDELQAALEKWSIKMKKANSGPPAVGRMVSEPLPAEEAADRLEEGYKVESILPVLEDVLPELKEIPAIWYKNWQRYHGSTLRALLAKAQLLSIPVRMEAGGREWEHIRVADMAITNGEHRIAIRCNDKMSHVSLEEIGRIKLELPPL
jgi:hypothetical protein